MFWVLLKMFLGVFLARKIQQNQSSFVKCFGVTKSKFFWQKYLCWNILPDFTFMFYYNTEFRIFFALSNRMISGSKCFLTGRTLDCDSRLGLWVTEILCDLGAIIYIPVPQRPFLNVVSSNTFLLQRDVVRMMTMRHPGTIAIGFM